MMVRPSILLVYTLLLGCVQISGLQGQYAKKSTTFSQVIEEAEKLGQKPYRPEKPRLRKEFLELDYDAYRKIQWNREQTLWAKDDLNFRLEFFHPGYLFKTPVRMNEFTESHIQNIPFTPEFFEYGDLDLNPRRISKRADYAGFRLLFPMNHPDRFDEVVSFLGASYFRALAAGQRYGKSARALALNTGLPEPEEFPEFKEFWIGKPDFQSARVLVYALMDSPSVAGAFQFEIQPGTETVIDVKSVLFFREPVEWLGLAPLTSMFWFGENGGSDGSDFRPEVHDSDGLLVHDGDVWNWRALANNGHQRNFTVPSDEFKGFGLMQRDRNFEHYQDLEGWYQARPSVWIEPRGDWGAGKVELIEFPTNHEYFDNVVAAWVPEKQPVKETAYEFSYRMHWTGAIPDEGAVARVESTRIGKDGNGGAGTLVVVEFSPTKEQTALDPNTLQLEVTGDTGAQITDIKLIQNPFGPRWRVTFRVSGNEAADLACRLLHEGKQISESWSYPWRPN
jgi:periplasmic glucans biosynthesis protein